MPTTDVFVRTCPETPLRAMIALVAIERWKLEPNTRLIVLDNPTLWRAKQGKAPYPLDRLDIPNGEHVYMDDEDDRKRFQWTSRAWADEHATSDPYVLIDDDHCPLGKDWVQRALKLWNVHQHPKLAFLGSDSIMPSENQRGNYERINGQACPEVYQAPYAMGAPLIHRKGIIDYTQFEGAAHQQDDIVTTSLRKRCLAFYYMRDVLYLHLGFGLSQVQPLLWLRH